jgi:ADP-heptose:LPS heptosyltransferase
LFVGSDTGPLHLAAAVGTACVGMYGPTRPADCGPYGPQHISLQSYYQDGSSRERRRALNDAMRAISVEQAVEACGKVLEHLEESAA